MMIGETAHRQNPTVQIQIPSWDPYEEPTSPTPSSFASSNGGKASSPFLESLTALHRYLPSNDEELDFPVDAFSCDHFRMYEFKVRRCARSRSHDWTECPYAHAGEKARRRDPRKYHYSGSACPDFRKSGCKKGDYCEFAHGVFECWLHPARYRTQPCNDGPACRRRVCFFAHTPEQLRVLPPQSPIGSGSDLDFGSPFRHHLDSQLNTNAGSFVSSPTSILASPPMSPPSDSPPMSPSSPQVVSELVASIRGLQLGKMKMGPGSWGMQAVSRFGSPRASLLRPGFCSLPSTPTGTMTVSGLSQPDFFDSGLVAEPPMVRVESGRELRAKMYAKLSRENSLAQADSVAAPGPDVGWVSELVK